MPTDETGVSRRGLLMGGAAGAAAVAGSGWLVENDVLPGRSRFYSALGLNGDGAPIPDVAPGRLVTGRFTSEARGGVEVRWAMSTPSDRRCAPGSPSCWCSTGPRATAGRPSRGLDLLPVRAVTASSPALDSVPDDAPESDDVLGRPERLDGIPLHIDCGRGDPFYPVVRDFVAALADLDPPPVSSFGPGGHTGPYRRTVAPAQLRFGGERLA